jgi:hypothetical protein
MSWCPLALGWIPSGPNSPGSAAPGIAQTSRHTAPRPAACSLMMSLARRIRWRATSTRPAGSDMIPAMSGRVQVSTVAPVAVRPSSSAPTPAAKSSSPKAGSRMSFIPTVTLARSGPSRAAAGSCRSSTMATLAPSAARLVSAHGTVVRALRIPASRRAHPTRAPPVPWSSRPAVRLSPSAA